LKGKTLLNAKKVVATVAALGAGFAAFSTGSVTQAEPVSNSYAIVGSDTLEDVVSAIVNGTAITGATVRVSQNGATLGSFDATGTPYVVTKPGGSRFMRPNGSGEGFMALSASMYEGGTAANNTFTSATYQIVNGTNVTAYASMPLVLKNVNVFGQVDIARSSSGEPKSNTARLSTEADAVIVRVPFARDAIALAFTPTLADAVCAAGQDGDAGAACVPYLTDAQLKSLFETTEASPTISINGTNVPAKGIIPQSGSGTRKDFVGKIGVAAADGTESAALTAAVTAGRVGVGQEHDATVAAMTGSAVMPMSASRWIAMQNKASFDKSGTAKIGSVYTATTLGASPVTGTAPALTPNATYYSDDVWGRDVYLFVERARIDNAFTAGGAIVAGSKFDSGLATLLDRTENKLSNTETTGASKVGKVKALFGFVAPKSTDLAYFKPSYAGTK
jgi:hypothetical protein